MRMPAGIENSFEIYRNEKAQVRTMVNGNRMDYMELPLILREPFQAELIADLKAQKSLNEMKIFDADEMEYKFVGCRYGAYDSNPDLKGHETCHDAPCCKDIKNCPGFNIICKLPEGKNGTLSRQEYLIVILISKGKLDKEIADQLSIEISTIRTHLSRIREKLCVNNRIEIAFWAINNGVI